MTPPAHSPAGMSDYSSPLSADQTVERLTQVVRDRGLTLFAHFDHAAAAAGVGLTMPAAHVLVFGNPRAGTPLMLASPLIALDLPLKVLVWQDASGRVLVSHVQPDWMVQRYSLPHELAGVLSVVEGIVHAALAGDDPRQVA